MRCTTTPWVPSERGGASETVCSLPLASRTRTPVTRTQLSGCVSVMISSTWHFGTIISRLRASGPGPAPSASVDADRAPSTRIGTPLNLLVGNWPGSARDCTASGASSFIMSRRSLRASPFGLIPSMARRSSSLAGWFLFRRGKARTGAASGSAARARLAKGPFGPDPALMPSNSCRRIATCNGP